MRNEKLALQDAERGRPGHLVVVTGQEGGRGENELGGVWDTVWGDHIGAMKTQLRPKRPGPVRPVELVGRGPPSEGRVCKCGNTEPGAPCGLCG